MYRIAALLGLFVAACDSPDKTADEGDARAEDSGAHDGGSGDEGAGDGGSGDEGAGDGGSGDEGTGDGGTGSDYAEADAVIRHDPLIIRGPSLGVDFATEDSNVVLDGDISTDAIDVAWSTATGSGGGAMGDGDWTADVSLDLGDNTVVVTATFDDDSTVTDQISIRRNNSATIQSAIQLSLSTALVDNLPDVVLAEVTVDELAPPTSIQLGVDDGAGGLSEVWADLAPLEGSTRWVGSFAPPTDAGTWTLRAVADDGAATPPLTWTLRDPPSTDALEAAWEVEDLSVDAFFADGDPEDGLIAAYTVLADAGVDGLTVDLRGAPRVSWIDPMGDPVVLAWRASGTKGSGAGSSAAPPPVSSPPLPSTLGTRALVIAPYFSTDFSGSDESMDLDTMFTESTCPKFEAVPALGSIGFLDAAAQDLDVWAQVLQADVVHISSHGEVSSITESGRTFEESQISTGIEFTLDDIPDHVSRYGGRGLLVGNRVCEEGAPCRPLRSVGLRPAFFQAGHVGEVDRGGIIVLSACSLMQRPDFAAAFHAGGASSVVGFTDVVDADYAMREVIEFWNDAVLRISPLDAADHFDLEPDDPLTPAYPVMSTREARIVGHHSIEDSSFDGATSWETYGNGPVFFGSIDGEPAMEATDDGAGAFLALNPLEGWTYTEIGVEVCPVEGESIAVSARWQVAANPYLSVSVFQDDFFILRLDEGDRTTYPSTTVGYYPWEDIQSLLSTSSGDIQGTGWQDSVWFATAPAPGEREGRQLSLAIGGWDAWEYNLAIDSFSIEIGEE